jgi:DNA-binding Lrp family transcriptional regulator
MRGINHDRELIRKLEENGRTTLKELGEVLGMSSMGVKKRLEKLIGDGTIRISVETNVEAEKILTVLLLFEAHDKKHMEEFIQRHEGCPRIVALYSMPRSNNMMVIMIAEDDGVLKSVMSSKCSIRKYIGMSTVWPIEQIRYSSFLHIRNRLAHRKSLTSPCGVECGTCISFKEVRCPGCPAVKIYRGSL